MQNPNYNPIILKIVETTCVATNVKKFILEKPIDYTFIPGQSVNVSINLPEWKEAKRPFTFTSLPTDNYIELLIKIYDYKHGVTEKLESINAGEELILHDVFGQLQFAGKGVFLAGGTGITPFISILRSLYKQNKIAGNSLIFSTQYASDVILHTELKQMLGKKYINTLTKENVVGFNEKRIDKDFLIQNIQNFNQHFYVCGPAKFVKDINDVLLDLGAKSDFLVFEE
jgi:ferredoxin-NADP reductase